VPTPNERFATIAITRSPPSTSLLVVQASDAIGATGLLAGVRAVGLAGKHP
jgi:hypothetical protein